eukprot:4016141-Heterocapsa_arctica.AAC.1
MEVVHGEVMAYTDGGASHTADPLGGGRAPTEQPRRRAGHRTDSGKSRALRGSKGAGKNHAGRVPRDRQQGLPP